MSTLIDHQPAYIPFESILRLIFRMISLRRVLLSLLAVDNNNNNDDEIGRAHV